MDTQPLVDETRVHRALGDGSRVRVLATLRAAAEPLDATRLAEHVGLHANTVRSHLRILQEARLVSSRPEERDRPGRPRLVYSATAEGLSHEERAGYRLLAEVLASHLADSGPDSSERAEQAGRAWGRDLVDRRPQLASSTAEEDIAVVVGLLGEVGFAPSVEAGQAGGHTLFMQHCPFGEAAAAYGKIVCSVHLGLIQGALATLGAHVEADELRPFVRPGVCAAHLETIVGEPLVPPRTPSSGMTRSSRG